MLDDFVVSISKEHIKLNRRNLLRIFCQEYREFSLTIKTFFTVNNGSPPLPCNGINSVIRIRIGRITLIFFKVFFTPIWVHESTTTKSVKSDCAIQVRGRKGRTHINSVKIIFALGSNE